MNLKYGQTRTTTRAESGAIDQGLRSYMLKIYNYMATGILVTGFVALFLFKYSVVTNEAGSITGLTNLGNAIYNSALMWVIARLCSVLAVSGVLQLQALLASMVTGSISDRVMRARRLSGLNPLSLSSARVLGPARNAAIRACCRGARLSAASDRPSPRSVRVKPSS